MNKRRRALLSTEIPIKARLPRAYQEVTWIKASAGAYINTNIVPTTCPRVVSDVLPIYDTSNRRTMMGFSSNSAAPYFNVQNYMYKASNITLMFGQNSNIEFSSADLKTNPSQWVHIDISNKFIVNKTTYNTVSTYDFSENTKPIYLFKGTSYSGVYSYKTIVVYDDTTKKGFFIPCYRKSDNKIGMYDLITDAFFPGNGTFTKGTNINVEYEHGTWEDLLRTIDAGTYQTEYELGEILPLTLGSYGTLNAQIVGFNLDTLSDGTGYAPITFICEKIWYTGAANNTALAGSEGDYTDGTGTIGGWEKWNIRSTYQNGIKNAFPTIIKNRLATVKKYTRGYTTTGTAVANMETSDQVWMASYREMFGGTTYETSGPIYTGWFTGNSRRIKNRASNNNTDQYDLRTAYSSSSNLRVGTNGALSTAGASGVFQTWHCKPIGFCII